MQAVNFNHKKGKHTRSYCVYTIYDNKTDMPVIVDGEARECAMMMNMTIASFYSAITRAKNRKTKRWYIERRFLDGKGKPDCRRD